MLGYCWFREIWVDYSSIVIVLLLVVSKFLHKYLRERRNKINRSIYWHYFFFYEHYFFFYEPVETVSLKIPSLVSKNFQLHPTWEIARVIDVPDQLNYIRPSVVGLVNSKRGVILCSYLKRRKKWLNIIIQTSSKPK